MSLLDTALTETLGIDFPIVGGAMYPCSNPELVAAVSEAGGIGILQPLTLVHVHDLDFREGVRRIKGLTGKPIGMNVINEKSAAKHLECMSQWLDVALEEGIRFFVSSLGNPRWIVDRVAPAGGIVFHDVTERKWAVKAADAGVHGLIAVNNRAGGHTGSRSAEDLLDEVAEFGLPVVCAGGVGDAQAFRHVLELGYVGAQMGTRLIATKECTSPAEYKQAIVSANATDIVATTRITGVPVSVIRTPYVEQMGTEAGPIARRLLAHPRTKHWVRGIYMFRFGKRLRDNMHHGMSHRDYYLAGKSVAGVHEVEPVATIVERFVAAAKN
ncbi:MAG: nitronate monooxygenase [Acidobacteriota bacterium]